MPNLTCTIIKKYVETSNCFSAISRDGITSNEFVISKSDGLFYPSTLNTQQKKRYPSIGKTFSIAKNLDYYQSKICQLVPALEDVSNVKLQLQVIRVIIIATLLKLVNIIHNLISESTFQEWNLHADLVLIAASENVQMAVQQGPKFQTTKKILASTFSYLQIDHPDLEREICKLYGR